MYSKLRLIAILNEHGLNIPYPYNIDWVGNDGIGLLVLEGFLERYQDELKGEYSNDGKDSETYKSEIDPYYYDKQGAK
jgi:hypothetical protein